MTVVASTVNGPGWTCFATATAGSVDAVQPKGNETIEKRTVRFRTVGDMSPTGCVESEADTIPKIIDEIAVTRLTERGATRGDDRFSEAAMEDRKKEGYF